MRKETDSDQTKDVGLFHNSNLDLVTPYVSTSCF
jgi:hypothetical protein